MKRVLALQQLDLTPPAPIEVISESSCLLLSCKQGNGGDNNNDDGNNNGGNNNDGNNE